jgi:hypothetical protein
MVKTLHSKRSSAPNFAQVLHRQAVLRRAELHADGVHLVRGAAADQRLIGPGVGRHLEGVVAQDDALDQALAKGLADARVERERGPARRSVSSTRSLNSHVCMAICDTVYCRSSHSCPAFWRRDEEVVRVRTPGA